jgi:ABC-type multidrug transport system fused ATPase/permease subunit
VGIGDLPKATIVILNDDDFPSAMGPETMEGDHLKYSEGQIVTAFANHLWQSLSSIGRWGMFFKIYPAIHWVMTQLLMLLSINIAYKEHVVADKDQTKFRTVMFSLAGAYLVSLGIWMLASWEFIELRLGGKSRMILKKAIAGTMLQLTEEEQEEFPAGEVIGITTDVVDNCVTKGWTGLFAMWQQLVTLAVLTAYTAYVTRKTPYLLAIPVIQLVVDYLVYWFRSAEQVNKAMHAIEAEDEWKKKLLDIAGARSVVTTFKASPIIVPGISKEIGMANKSLWQSDRYASDTQKILKAFHSLFIVLCFVGGAELWLENNADNFKTGNFVALMATIFKFDSTIGALFTKMNDMNVGYSYIRRMATLLNADTRRKQQLRWDEDFAKSEPPAPEHEDDIVVHDCSYQFRNSENVVGPFSFSIEQGQVVCVTGAEGSISIGKKTLLKLIARLYLPTTGYISCPGSLRVRYIPVTPLIWKGTLMYNLRFGQLNKVVTKKDEDGNDVTVYPTTEDENWEVWKLVGGNKFYCNHNHNGANANARNMSRADQTCISVARALLSNLDLLLVGGTFDALGEAASTRMMLVLRDWVAERGLECLSNNASNVPTHLKKKKTVIFATKNSHLTSEASAVIELHPKT